jgi:predicted nucleic acid-binding protein
LKLSHLRAFIRRHARVALDTSVFIYQLEPNQRYSVFTNEIFSWLDLKTSLAITSTITMTELLVQPLREKNEATARLYYGLLSRHPNLHWVAPDLEVANLAAHYRAQHRLRTINAIHAATAVAASATGMITNDAQFARVEALDVLVLEDLLRSHLNPRSRT